MFHTMVLINRTNPKTIYGVRQMNKRYKDALIGLSAIAGMIITIAFVQFVFSPEFTPESTYIEDTGIKIGGSDVGVGIEFDNVNATNPEPDWKDAKMIRENLKSIKNNYYIDGDYYYVTICLNSGWCYQANNLTQAEAIAMVDNYSNIPEPIMDLGV